MAALFLRRNQLQWLALLAIAVVLPTVSLLWFMSRVIANERLVVQQKLTALYGDKLAGGTDKTVWQLKARLAGLDRAAAGNPYVLFRRLVSENNFQGVVVWGADGGMAYPKSADVMLGDVTSASPLSAAWQAEFAQRQYNEAANLYDRFTTNADPQLAVVASAGKSRCLAKLGQLEAAIAECQKAAFPSAGPGSELSRRLAIENARLLLLSLLKQAAQRPASGDVAGGSSKRAELFRRTVDALMHDVYDPSANRALLPANQNLFIAKKTLEALAGPFPWDDTRAKEQLEKLVAAEELSIAAAESQRPFGGRVDGFFKWTPSPAGGAATESAKPLYGLRHETPSSAILILLSDAGLASVLAGYQEAFAGTESSYRIVDGGGEVMAGAAQSRGRPFNVTALPDAFPGWKIELYFEGSDVFEKAAGRQIAVYTWTGFLVIVMILVVGGFVMRAVGRQIRLNEMKNDFIATVSHELKTPLASMRVLVDTLLEGRVRDAAQATEYLGLVSRENERLSRMIDNFLTFSRMERNKVAFAIAEARPAAIVHDALEAVQTKFAVPDCHLTVNVADPLPEIQADHDAIVTVLVNLLDNARKYTADHKEIALKVFPDHGSVCFAVSDNGIGLARRHIRRIFDRFYQVDNSLARKAEGCGLGLSIVKFIVDAHKGRITVESKAGQGSTFTVRLPVGRNGNGGGD